MPARAGLLVRRAGVLSFLSARVAKRVLPAPRLSKIPWDDAKMALVGGEIVAVLELGRPSGVLVLCEVEGHALALSGLSAERAGFWPESAAGGVSVDGAHVAELELGPLLSEFQQSTKDGTR